MIKNNFSYFRSTEYPRPLSDKSFTKHFLLQLPTIHTVGQSFLTVIGVMCGLMAVSVTWLSTLQSHGYQAPVAGKFKQLETFLFIITQDYSSWLYYITFKVAFLQLLGESLHFYITETPFCGQRNVAVLIHNTASIHKF